MLYNYNHIIINLLSEFLLERPHNLISYTCLCSQQNIANPALIIFTNIQFVQLFYPRNHYFLDLLSINISYPSFIPSACVSYSYCMFVVIQCACFISVEGQNLFIFSQKFPQAQGLASLPKMNIIEGWQTKQNIVQNIV